MAKKSTPSDYPYNMRDYIDVLWIDEAPAINPRGGLADLLQHQTGRMIQNQIRESHERMMREGQLSHISGLGNASNMLNGPQSVLNATWNRFRDWY